MNHDEEKSSSYGLLGVVGSISLHVLVLGLLGLSCMMSKPEEPPPFKEVEFFDVTPVDPMPPAPVETPQVDEPAPPEETPPDPEPPKVEPPKVETPKVEPPKVEPPKVETPKPLKADPPKPSREDALRERLKNAKVNPATPQKPSKPAVNPDDITKRINQRISDSRPTVVRPSGVPNLNNLNATQMTAYENYLASCLEPHMARLWEVNGPERLATVPKDAQVSLMISPDGRVISGYVSGDSDSARMNECARVLLEKLKAVKLPPFSQVHLQSSAALRFVVNLKYQVQNH